MHATTATTKLDWEKKHRKLNIRSQTESLRKPSLEISSVPLIGAEDNLAPLSVFRCCGKISLPLLPYSSNVIRTRVCSSSGPASFRLYLRCGRYIFWISFTRSVAFTNLCRCSCSDFNEKWLWNWLTANAFNLAAFSARFSTYSNHNYTWTIAIDLF